MSSKHTPGPWAYVEIARTPDGRECGQLIGPASCAALIVEQDGSDAGAANVALAAAAPDLLDFVRRVVADAGATVCKGANGEPELCGGLDPAILLDEFFRHGKKAIARAEGR